MSSHWISVFSVFSPTHDLHRTLLMLFWAWGRDREERFELEHTQRLGDLFVADTNVDLEEKEPLELITAPHDGPSTSNEPSPELSAPLARHPVAVRRADGKPQNLPLISRMAIFYGSTPSGVGVPHSFAEFLRGYPALPRIVVFLNTRVMAIPHVDSRSRYSVNKVRSMEGFYSITMRMGYLEHKLPVAEDIALALASHSQVSEVGFEDAITHITHVLPTYNFSSNPRATTNRVTSWIRRFLIEEGYARARVMFPDPVRVQSIGNERSVAFQTRTTLR